MAEEPNGHDGSSRLDRIERAIEALIEGHEGLLVSHKQLLTAQIVMTDTITTLGKRVDALTERVDALTQRVDVLVAKVDSHEDRIQALIDSQLRVDETLAFIKKLLERPQGGSPPLSPSV